MARRTPRSTLPPEDANRLVAVHTRFFADSITEVKRIAASTGLPWQVELRLIVRRALRVALLKEK